MSESTLNPVNKPTKIHDPLTEILRTGARQLLAQAIEAEVAAFMAQYADLTDEQGRQRVVRNGYLPKREVQTGIGAVEVQVPRVRDRAPRNSTGLDRIQYQSMIVPPYLRRSKSVETLLPWLYLKGISTGDLGPGIGPFDALQALLGPEAPGLSATTISRLKAQWGDAFKQWTQRSLEKKRYVYFWVDGVYFNIRSETDKSCILVINRRDRRLGATEAGDKELVAVEEGFREGEISWRDILLDLKARGLKVAPRLAVGDGALGFWTALAKVYPATQAQRCWVHKTANVLNALPKSQQSKAKTRLHQIYLAESKEEAERAFDHFINLYQSKYPKATHCLQKDRAALLAFYEYPAEGGRFSALWVHLRTTNPIESTFATVRLRTAKTRGCVSRQTILMLVFRLCQCAERYWRRLNGSHHLVSVLNGIQYINGIRPDPTEKDQDIGIAA